MCIRDSYEPDHNESITDIECSVERCQFKGYRHSRITDLHYMGNKPWDGIRERVEEHQNPHDTENVENNVRCV